MEQDQTVVSKFKEENEEIVEAYSTAQDKLNNLFVTPKPNKRRKLSPGEDCYSQGKDDDEKDDHEGNIGLGLNTKIELST